MIRQHGCTAVLGLLLLALTVAHAQESAPPGTLAPAGSAPAATASGATTAPATTVPATTTAPIEALQTIGSGTPPISAPLGAIILFDGESTDAWTTRDGKPSPWKVVDEAMVAGGGDIISQQKFEDYQLHVEFWLPKFPPEVKGQHRGNSGVYLHGRYEIQVLDSFQLPSDKYGCGAIYGKKKPKENACTPPQTWQSYDIKFTAPKFDAAGEKVANARVSVIHNGVTIHDDVEVDGPTRSALAENERPGPAPIMLQDHGNPVRFRNIYVVPTKPEPTADATPATTRPSSVRPPL